MSDEWGCVTIILCTWCGVAICQHGDITEISSQVVQSYKCFNGEVNSRKIFNAKQLNKNGKAQAVMVVLSYGSVFQLTTETVLISGTKWRKTYCQVMTGTTSFWMSTVAPPFSSASTTYSWPSWHAAIIAVQPSWSGMTIGAHWNEEHELTPTGS